MRALSPACGGVGEGARLAQAFAGLPPPFPSPASGGGDEHRVRRGYTRLIAKLATYSAGFAGSNALPITLNDL